MPRREKLKDLQREKETFAGRTLFAALLCLGMVALLIFRLANLQIFNRAYYATRADENRMRVSAVPPVRGLMYDRHGTVLAQNTPAFVLEVIPEQVEDLDALIEQLRPLVAISERDVARFKDRVRKSPRYLGVPLRTNLSMEEVARFELNRYDFRGVDINAGLTRQYPLGSSAAHVIGYVGGINEDELQVIDEALYQGLTQIGKIGVEKSHENELRGSPGARIVEANAFGRPLRELERREGVPGRNLVLTLDARVQLAAEQALGELNGSVVALDPRNGELLALVSKPGFDPHPFVEGIDGRRYRALLEDRRRPLYNRALQGTYPPGSTVKPFFALVGLEEVNLDPDHREFCGGEYTLPGSSRKYRCHKRQGHGWMDMAQGVIKSCDIYFYALAQVLGIDRLSAALGTFGLGSVTGLDLPLEKSGILPSREWKRRTRREAWYPGETLNIGIGQGYLTVTPMQLAQMTARLAMRGGGYQPRVVHAYQDPVTLATTPVAAVPLAPIINRHPAEWERVIDSMEDVSHTLGGTAYRSFGDAPYRVAGKTGTAQVAGLSQDEEEAPELGATPYHLRDHALFIAFAPADEPRIAVAVIAEHAGHGGAAAAPIARQVMDQALLGEIRWPASPSASAPAAPAASPVPAAPPAEPEALPAAAAETAE
ncbi:MAG TPA: penicillin-binding protein 2 [Nevskiaceae bacterium]|nr:penicillin-binding protein 2 [Nevskiaceae bacterium]